MSSTNPVHPVLKLFEHRKMALTRRIGETTRMVGTCERLVSSVFLKKTTFECKVDSSSRMSSTSPVAGILHRSPQSEEIVKAVKAIRPDIRLDVIVSGIKSYLFILLLDSPFIHQPVAKGAFLAY